MLTVKNVRKSYDDFDLNVSMKVEPGQITGLIGANGAGKSTTFKAILDLIHWESGEIEIFGKNNRDLSTKDKEDMGVVLGNACFSEVFRIQQIVPIMDSLYHNFHKEEFLHGCEEYKLPLNKPIKDFSSGMKARLCLLLAMSHEAKFLILDEPTAGLDVIARDALLDSLRKYMETPGRSILISSHISSDLENFCDDIYVLHRGQIVLHEDVDVLRERGGIDVILHKVENGEPVGNDQEGQR